MKVSTLIKKLEKFNPDARVTFCTLAGESSGVVMATVSEDKKRGTITLNCRGDYRFGEKQ